MKTNTHPLVRTCIALLASAGVAQASLIFEDHFTSTVGLAPTGWTATTTGSPAPSNNDVVSATNLTYTGLAVGSGGSFAHDGSRNQGYRRDFSASPLGAGETVYYSFLFRLDDIGGITTAGSTSAVFGLSLNTNDAPGNGMVSSWGIRLDAADSSKFNLSVDGEFRGAGSTSSKIVGGTTGGVANTAGTQYDVGTTYLLVASYTNSTSSTSSFWVNPVSLGGAAPTATVTDASPTARSIQSVLMNSIMGTTNSTGTLYSVDAIRVGTSFADVTAIPEPSTLVLVAISLSAVVFLRRCR